MHTAAVAAALVALSTGAMAAPIAANLRIDPSEVVLFPTDVTERLADWRCEPILLPDLDQNLSRLSPEFHWEPALIFPGAPLGDLQEESPAKAASAPPQLSIVIPEPPAVVMSASGFGLGAAMLWRQRGRQRNRRRRRRLMFRVRAMAATL